MTMGRKRKRVTERVAQNAESVASKRRVSRFLYMCRSCSTRKRQHERPPEPEKAGGKQMDGPGELLLV